jgi:hypothetical protein
MLAAGHREKLLHVAEIEVAHAPRADAAALAE